MIKTFNYKIWETEELKEWARGLEKRVFLQAGNRLTRSVNGSNFNTLHAEWRAANTELVTRTNWWISKNNGE